jgi:hypothetical protein
MRPYLPVPAAPAPTPFAWGTRARIGELLGEGWTIGFEDGVQPFLAASPSDAWDTWIQAYGPIRRLAAGLPADRAAQFRDDMLAFHERFATDLGVLKPRQYLLAVGVRR